MVGFMPFSPPLLCGSAKTKTLSSIQTLSHAHLSAWALPCLSLVDKVYQWDTVLFDAFFLDFSCKYHPNNQKTCPDHCSRQFFTQCHRSGNLWLNSFPPELFICLVSSCRTCSGLAWIFCHTQLLTACLIILILKCSNGAATGHLLYILLVYSWLLSPPWCLHAGFCVRSCLWWNFFITAPHYSWLSLHIPVVLLHCFSICANEGGTTRPNYYRLLKGVVQTHCCELWIHQL